MTKEGEGRVLEEEEEEEEEEDREKRRQTLTSLFVLSSENAHSWFTPECNTALCYCLRAALPSVPGVRCHKQCNTILG